MADVIVFSLAALILFLAGVLTNEAHHRLFSRKT